MSLGYNSSKSKVEKQLNARRRASSFFAFIVFFSNLMTGLLLAGILYMLWKLTIVIIVFLGM